MDDEQRFRVYRNINRRITWERRSAMGLSWLAGFLAGFGVCLVVLPRMEP